ncbi:MAG: oxygen-dependent coproporphyrinogen oxidase [Chromatiales bacterium]|nr:oxygen-dependent coproporphyrinogen oxidase [Chromatiales bacterium]
MNIESVTDYLLGLQSRLCRVLSQFEENASFTEDPWHSKLGKGRTHIFSGGQVLERAGVNFSYVHGDKLPPAALSETAARSVDGAFEATGISIVVHPLNPHVPTVHCNLRFFKLDDTANVSHWWFGGGYDLTPYYPYREDVVDWHRAAHSACAPFGDDVYNRYKKWCDEYFYIKHRAETRGVGGLFFDNLNEWGFDKCFSFMRSIGDSFATIYPVIVDRRYQTPHDKRQREFQLYRRGRYVEFNLVYDRGTLFGLQSGGRVESILMSLPPQVRWHYDWQPEHGSAEEDLYVNYLKPRDWLGVKNTNDE